MGIYQEIRTKKFEIFRRDILWAYSGYIMAYSENYEKFNYNFSYIMGI